MDGAGEEVGEVWAGGRSYLGNGRGGTVRPADAGGPGVPSLFTD